MLQDRRDDRLFWVMGGFQVDGQAISTGHLFRYNGAVLSRVTEFAHGSRVYAAATNIGPLVLLGGGTDEAFATAGLRSTALVAVYAFDTSDNLRAGHTMQLSQRRAMLGAYVCALWFCQIDQSAAQCNGRQSSVFCGRHSGVGRRRSL